MHGLDEIISMNDRAAKFKREQEAKEKKRAQAKKRAHQRTKPEPKTVYLQGKFRSV